MRANFYGFDVNKMIARHKITDISDLRLVERASEMHWSDWPLLDDLIRHAREGGTVALLEDFQKIMYHMEEHKTHMD